MIIKNTKKINIGFQIFSLGCKVNQYDAAVLRRELEKRGFSISKKPVLVIINTCTVTKTAITKDRQLANKLHREFPKAFLVVMGCWPETDEQADKAIISDNVLFWGVGKTEKLIEKILEHFPDSKSDFIILESGIDNDLLASTDRSRYFLKVGDGCNQFCSYCLIPFARGRLKSRPSSELIKEIKAAAEFGYREIVLSGIHLGRYGEDKKGKEKNLVGLLKGILKIKNLGRIRLSSIEINEVNPELINLMKKERKICRHLHISLQSGTDKILKSMNRPYTTAYFARRVMALRKAMPEIAISTDIIVGFPGESDADFLKTLEFSKKIEFSKIHVFSYSEHEKTKAAKMPDKVSAPEIKKRSQALHDLSLKLEDEYQKRILNLYKKGGLSLIKEHGERGGYLRAKTEFGFDIYLSPKELVKNSLI
jgi:threonylcarbamoyladenosine tRNA methylthiotransferase MtaB